MKSCPARAIVYPYSEWGLVPDGVPLEEKNLKYSKYTKIRRRFTQREVVFYFPLRVPSAGGHQA